ncbi:MAG: S-layer homology domain-containing protein [Clostridia bacterium]|nr:S-layer homology domain-containing protein [Clostridia bacterium]
MKKFPLFIKTVASVLALMFCISCFSVFAVAADPILLVTYPEAKPGDIVSISVNIANNPGIAGMRIEVSFDNEVLLPVSVSKGAALNTSIVTTNLTSPGVDIKNLSTVTGVFVNSSNETRNGEIFVFSFRIKEDVKVKSTSLAIDCVEASNAYLESVAVTSAIAKINILVSDAEEDESDKVKADIKLRPNAKNIKYMAGYADGTFKPTQNATRYEVVEALSYLFEIGMKVDSGKSFKDVDSRYNAVVKLFTSAGVLDGYPDGTFRGNNPIKRGEFCKIVTLLLDLDTTRVKDFGFKDVKKHWAEANINACAAKGFIEGKGNGRFDPDGYIKRGEVATIINRITGAKPGTTCIYTDLDANDPAQWYFGAVAAAAK